MVKQNQKTFDPTPFKKAILEIQTLEKKMLREIREEAEEQDRRREINKLPTI